MLEKLGSYSALHEVQHLAEKLVVIEDLQMIVC